MLGGFGALLLRPDALPDANPPLFRGWDRLSGVLDCTPPRHSIKIQLKKLEVDFVKWSAWNLGYLLVTTFLSFRRPLLVECPTKEVREAYAKLLEKAIASFFLMGGVSVGKPVSFVDYFNLRMILKCLVLISCKSLLPVVSADCTNCFILNIHTLF